MKERGNVFLTAAALATIVGLSLLVAIVTFGLLKSSAEADIRGYKLGGAIAAFAFTAGLLTSAFFNVYRLLTADEVKEYAKRIEELQSKLIRGAPCPRGYTIDVDERHRLVFARPVDWKPKEGVLYQYLSEPKASDPVRANFNVVYVSEDALADSLGGELDPTPAVIEDIYKRELAGIASAVPGQITQEYVTVDGCKSVKYINTYAPSDLPEGKKVKVRQSGVLTFVPKMNALFVFTFTDSDEDYLASSEVFGSVLESVRFL
jgi:hypothetical protein